MNILLLGGTGAMGCHLTEILSADINNHLTVTSRRHRESKGNIHFIEGNAHDNAFIQKLLQDEWDVIVDFMVYTTDEFKNRIGLLLEACGQYVFLSSSRVYADSETAITETSNRLLDVCDDKGYLSTDEYALTKARQENVLRESGKNNWTIIRPYITFAENRLQLGVLELQGWLYRALLGNTIVFSEDIAQKYTTLTYGYDVARGIASIIGKDSAFGRAFHITVSDSMKWKDVLELYINVIESETGNRPKVKMLEKHPYISKANRCYQVIYDRWYDRRFDNSAISEFIDTSSFLSTEDGIKKALTTFIRNNPELKFPLNPSHEGTYDRITGEHTDLSLFDGKKSKLKYILSRYFPSVVPFLRDIKRLIK